MNTEAFAKRVEDAWRGLTNRPQHFWLLPWGDDFLLASNGERGAKYVGSFTVRWKNHETHRWVPLSLKDFSDEIHAVLAEMRPA